MKYWGYPDEEEAENLDTDWFYRRAFPAVWRRSVVMVNGLRQQVVVVALSGLSGLMHSVQRHHGPGGVLARTWAAGTMVMLGKIALALYLAMYLLT